MKMYLLSILMLFSFSLMAKTRLTRADRKAAKEACLMKDSTLKGKKLRACVKEELKMKMKSEEETMPKMEEQKEKKP